MKCFHPLQQKPLPRYVALTKLLFHTNLDDGGNAGPKQTKYLLQHLCLPDDVIQHIVSMCHTHWYCFMNSTMACIIARCHRRQPAIRHKLLVVFEWRVVRREATMLHEIETILSRLCFQNLWRVWVSGAYWQSPEEFEDEHQRFVSGCAPWTWSGARWRTIMLGPLPQPRNGYPGVNVCMSRCSIPSKNLMKCVCDLSLAVVPYRLRGTAHANDFGRRVYDAR